MSIQGYDEELWSERSYVAGLYARLDAERVRVRGEYKAVLRGNGGTLVEWDVAVRALVKEVRRLDVVEDGLCFGRLDTVSGEHSYIGRIGLVDEENEYEPVLLDWRAPVAVVDRQRLPEQSLPIDLADLMVWIDAEIAEWAREEARVSGLAHNEARAVFGEVLTWVLTERAIARIGRGWLTRADRQAWEQLRAATRRPTWPSSGNARPRPSTPPACWRPSSAARI
ncbi:MAG: hypothetical protein ACRDRX_15450 [Pseudonocardiaceae bacterium]